MTSYDEHLKTGNRRREAAHNLLGAIEEYHLALEIGGPRDRYCQQMIGVCLAVLGEHEGAIEWYLQALEGSSDYERGNIERDLADSYRALGELEHAEASIATSLELLARDQYPIEHAASLGFLSRLQRTQGQLQFQLALEAATEADRVLSAGPDRRLELSHKLNRAAMQSEAHQPFAARLQALAALRLTRQRDADGHHLGTFVHQLRIVALLVGGHRLERVSRNLLTRYRSRKAGRKRNG